MARALGRDASIFRIRRMSCDCWLGSPPAMGATVRHAVRPTPRGQLVCAGAAGKWPQVQGGGLTHRKKGASEESGALS